MYLLSRSWAKFAKLYENMYPAVREYIDETTDSMPASKAKNRRRKITQRHLTSRRGQSNGTKRKCKNSILPCRPLFASVWAFSPWVE